MHRSPVSRQDGISHDRILAQSFHHKNKIKIILNLILTFEIPYHQFSRVVDLFFLLVFIKFKFDTEDDFKN